MYNNKSKSCSVELTQLATTRDLEYWHSAVWKDNFLTLSVLNRLFEDIPLVLCHETILMSTSSEAPLFSAAESSTSAAPLLVFGFS